MVYIILSVFVLTALLAFVEDRLPKKYNMILYLFLGFVLVLVAGLRKIGVDPDSQNYEMYYLKYYDLRLADAVEYSFILISSILNHISKDVHVLFVFYAIIGVSLKFAAFRKYSPYLFLTLVVYLGYYYELHEITQIRTGILSGLFLLAIIEMAEDRKWMAFILIATGSFFHTSGLILFPLLFLKNKELNRLDILIWALIIPASYLTYFVSDGLNMVYDIPYIGRKLALYQAAEVTGQTEVAVNVFSPMQLFAVLLYYYMLFFSTTITTYNRYFPIMIKIFGIGICCYVVLSFLPVLAERMSYLLRIVSVILYTDISYTIRPRWAGILAVELLALLYLNYSLQPFDFVLFWSV